MRYVYIITIFKRSFYKISVVFTFFTHLKKFVKKKPEAFTVKTVTLCITVKNTYFLAIGEHVPKK